MSSTEIARQRYPVKIHHAATKMRADTLAEHSELTATSAAEGFRRADQQAWHAVNDPLEGTILSVSRAAANAAPPANSSRRVSFMVR